MSIYQVEASTIIDAPTERVYEIEKRINPSITRDIYREELAQLASIVEKKFNNHV